MTDDSFTIKPYHWWFTICIAIALHILLFVNYERENEHNHHHNADKNEIIIGLKNLKPSPKIEKPSVIETTVVTPKQVEPIKAKPILKKRETPKPKPITKSQIPASPKPVIVAPQVSPIKASKKQSNTAKSSLKTSPSLHVTNSSVNTDNVKALYYAKLAQWLEQHKKYPTIARRRNQQGNVTIQFLINTEGELLSFHLVKPSEHASLNSATIKMLERASPMPTPPKELMGNKATLEFTIPVSFSLVR